MQKMLESKRAARKELASLPFAQKLELLEKLRNHALLEHHTESGFCEKG